MKKPTAFFDIDGTIIKGSTGLHFTRALFDSGYIRVRNLVAASYYGTLHFLNIVDQHKMFRQALALLEGYQKRKLDSLVQKYFHEYIKFQIYIGTWQIIEEHKQRNEPVVLISAAPLFLIESMAEFFNADGIISTDIFFDENNQLTTQLAETLCYGDGKVVLAEKYLQGSGINLEDCYFYSDSSSDLPLLERVKYPVAINPDWELSIKAIKNRWTVYKFTDLYNNVARPKKFNPIL